MSQKLIGGTLDIESFPGYYRSFAHNMYEAKLMREEKPVRLASFSYKRLGGKPYTRGYWQYKSYRHFLKDLWRIFDENDFLIGHNIKRFDTKQSNTFFAPYGIKNPSPCVMIDTLSIVKQNFKLPSYSLKYCLVYFKIGHKIETGGESMWFLCEEGDPVIRKQFLKYNQNDTVQNEKFYFFLKKGGWIKNHPGENYYTEKDGCPRCHSHNLQKRGAVPAKYGLVQYYSCNECGKRFPGALIEKWTTH